MGCIGKETRGKEGEGAEWQQRLGVLSRGDDGQLRAFHNVCRHKAAPIAEGSGCVKMFECMYHGWEYGGPPVLNLLKHVFLVPTFCSTCHR